MKKIKNIIFVIILLLVCGCSNTGVANIDEIISSGNYILVDVRSKYEYRDSHIENALNIPHDEIDEEVELDKEKVILVYCRSGNRSKMAREKLEKLGYEVYDLGAMTDIDLFESAK